MLLCGLLRAGAEPNEGPAGGGCGGRRWAEAGGEEGVRQGILGFFWQLPALSLLFFKTQSYEYCFENGGMPSVF